MSEKADLLCEEIPLFEIWSDLLEDDDNKVFGITSLNFDVSEFFRGSFYGVLKDE